MSHLLWMWNSIHSFASVSSFLTISRLFLFLFLITHWLTELQQYCVFYQWKAYGNSESSLCLVAQLCLTLCDPMDCSPPGSFVHGDSPGKNTGVGCHALLQGIFPTSSIFCRWILYRLSHKGSPYWCHFSNSICLHHVSVSILVNS